MAGRRRLVLHRPINRSEWRTGQLSDERALASRNPGRAA